MQNGCGCLGNAHGAGWNWCSNGENDCPGWECAYHPDQAKDMLASYHAKGDPTDPYAMYNEVVIDGKKWNANLKTGVWAFWLPTSCGKGPKCEVDFWRYVNLFKTQYGVDVPTVGIDLSKSLAPFYALSQEADDLII